MVLAYSYLGSLLIFDFQFTDALSFARRIQLPLVDITANICDSSDFDSCNLFTLKHQTKT